jgi:hypothetical protein
LYIRELLSSSFLMNLAATLACKKVIYAGLKRKGARIEIQPRF